MESRGSAGFAKPLLRKGAHAPCAFSLLNVGLAFTEGLANHTLRHRGEVLVQYRLELFELRPQGDVDARLRPEALSAACRSPANGAISAATAPCQEPSDYPSDHNEGNADHRDPYEQPQQLPLRLPVTRPTSLTGVFFCDAAEGRHGVEDAVREQQGQRHPQKQRWEPKQQTVGPGNGAEWNVVRCGVHGNREVGHGAAQHQQRQDDDQIDGRARHGWCA